MSYLTLDNFKTNGVAKGLPFFLVNELGENILLKEKCVYYVEQVFFKFNNLVQLLPKLFVQKSCVQHTYPGSIVFCSLVFLWKHSHYRKERTIFSIRQTVYSFVLVSKLLMSFLKIAFQCYSYLFGFISYLLLQFMSL